MIFVNTGYGTEHYRGKKGIRLLAEFKNVERDQPLIFRTDVQSSGPWSTMPGSLDDVNIKENNIIISNGRHSWLD